VHAAPPPPNRYRRIAPRPPRARKKQTTPPPMPVCVASTTPSSATAASIALPPRRSTSSAVSVARGCDVAAITRILSASERPGNSKSREMSLQNGKRRVPQIRDQHGGWRVRDAQRRPRILHRQWGGKSAGPEDRQLVIGDLRVADVKIAPAQIHADAPGVAEVDGSAMNVGKPRRDLNGADGVRWLEGPHGHPQRTLERPRRD